MADVELNSIGNGDGNNYLVRDNTKIPLSGSNAISGNLIPSTDGTVNLGSGSYYFREGYFGNVFCGGLFGNPNFGIDINYTRGANLILRGKDRPNEEGIFWLVADNGSNSSRLMGAPGGILTWNNKNVAMQEDTVPRSGGAVMTGNMLARTVNNEALELMGGPTYNSCAYISLSGKNHPADPGQIIMACRKSDGGVMPMFLYPSGTWTWAGQPCQTASDQRLKQQITKIDDKLLDAWEDVNLVQFKYNDAVEQKSDNARLHTGYVVQQIDSACKKHGVDVSKYGLYCHEEYAEETREVEQADGTKTVEVVRPASEHYSLRYTEALIVECAYLRKKNKDLQEQLNALSERLEKLENR